MNYNLTLVNCDTDSIMVCKPDQTSWTVEEQERFLNALNNIFPEQIHFEHDGIYSKVCILKAKNYILIDENNNMKIKGSALKDQKSPPKIRQFKEDLINLLFNKASNSELVDCYHKYIKEIYSLSKIDLWVKKITVTEKVLTSERTNERKIRDAIRDTVVQQGDKIYVFFLENEELCLLENFAGNYSRKVLMKQLFSSIQIFKNLLDTTLFLNYNLKRNLIALNTLLSTLEVLEKDNRKQ